MTTSDLLNSSLQSLARTKGRSVLTMLGIVIGIMSVILMLSIGEAAQRFILTQISAFGSDLLFIQNGAEVEEGQPTLFIKESLTEKDVNKLRDLPWVTAIVGKVFQEDQLNAQGLDANIQLVGTGPDELQMGDARVSQGTFISAAAVSSRTREAVLGYEIAQDAFGADDPVGKNVRINGQGFKVIGVMAKAGSNAFQDADNQVYVPVSTALDLYNKKYLTFIQVKTNLTNLSEAKERVRVILREKHNIDNPDGDLAKDDFHIQTQEDLVKSANSITGILQILLISIAAISLLVGGIGIMNIMYVSVTERIREIGLRKSLGARQPDILGQFLVEAVLQTLIGGAIGILLGVTLSWLGIQIISQFQDGWSFKVSSNGILLGLTVSGAIGVIFGYFPARRAAQMSPMDALRYE